MDTVYDASQSISVRQSVKPGDQVGSLEGSLVVDLKDNAKLKPILSMTLYRQVYDPEAYKVLGDTANADGQLRFSQLDGPNQGDQLRFSQLDADGAVPDPGVPYYLAEGVLRSPHEGYVLVPIKGMVGPLYHPQDVRSAVKKINNVTIDDVAVALDHLEDRVAVENLELQLGLLERLEEEGQYVSIGRSVKGGLRPIVPVGEENRNDDGCDSTISRNHCYISVGEDGTVLLTDIGTDETGSLNGTCLGGKSFASNTYSWPEEMLVEMGINVGTNGNFVGRIAALYKSTKYGLDHNIRTDVQPEIPEPKHDAVAISAPRVHHNTRKEEPLGKKLKRWLRVAAQYTIPGM